MHPGGQKQVPLPSKYAEWSALLCQQASTFLAARLSFLPGAVSATRQSNLDFHNFPRSETPRHALIFVQYSRDYI